MQIKSIHCKRVDVDEATAGQAYCFCIKPMDKKEIIKRNFFRKGMILIDRDANP